MFLGKIWNAFAAQMNKLANFFWTSSLRQDRTGDPAITATCRKWAGPSMILFGLTITFAAVDWMMSLSPAWFSTMFGVYFFAACVTCGYSVMTLICLRLQRDGQEVRIIDPSRRPGGGPPGAGPNAGSVMPFSKHALGASPAGQSARSVAWSS